MISRRDKHRICFENPFYAMQIKFDIDSQLNHCHMSQCNVLYIGAATNDSIRFYHCQSMESEISVNK